MSDFLRFFNEQVKHFPMHLAVRYSKRLDWCIEVWKKVNEDGKVITILEVQDSDMELAFALAHIKLKDWLRENNGGY